MHGEEGAAWVCSLTWKSFWLFGIKYLLLAPEAEQQTLAGNSIK